MLKKTPNLQKLPQILPNCFYTLMSWFSRPVDIKLYCKRVMKTPFFFLHFCFTGPNVQSHTISSLQIKIQRYDWLVKDTECF